MALGEMEATVVDDLYAAYVARSALERLDAERLVVLGGIYANSNIDGQHRIEAIRNVNDSFQRSREQLLYQIESAGEPEPSGDDGLWWKKPKAEESA